MALPQQVQAALAAAEATLAEVNAAPAAPSAELSQMAQQPSAVEPVATAEPLVAAPAQTPAPPPQHDAWEARYKTLQGLFNKQVPELQGRVKELEGSLTTAIERLNRASAEKEQALEPRQADSKDVDAFGADLVEMVQRVAQAYLGRAAQAFDAKAAELEQKVDALSQALTGTRQTVAASVEETFFDRLTKLVPDWTAVNADQGFLAWLSQEDPVYGVPRQNALNVAREQLNVERTAAVFRAYTGPAKAVPTVDPLDKQVSPRGAATAAPTPTELPVVTQAQITQFYQELRQGRYRGNEAEAARIEQVINTALADGRVR
jgi:uncharacterized protein YukE